jgi:hypothetical protein
VAEQGSKAKWNGWRCLAFGAAAILSIITIGWAIVHERDIPPG